MKKPSIILKLFEKIGGTKNPQNNPPINYNYNQNNENNNSQIKSIPPQNQVKISSYHELKLCKNPPVTIVGDFLRANSFGISHKEYHIRVKFPALFKNQKMFRALMKRECLK